MAIISMGKFTAIGMRTSVSDETGIVINTCSDNDTDKRGDIRHWSWSNPTNRRYPATYLDVTAVSTECMWQGTKITDMFGPDPLILEGNWRRAKGKRPLGAYNGKGEPLITSPGDARRKIYVPTFRNQIESWIRDDNKVREMLEYLKHAPVNVYLRDFDTGRGIDRNGPMSHAWVLAVWLNTGEWPN